MTTQYQPKPFVINLNDLVYLLAQVNFVPLFDGPANSNGIVNFAPATMDAWDAKGNLIWDHVSQTGTYKDVALTPANVALLGQGFPSVSAPIGIRDVSGLHNNLFGTQADWGAVDVPFRRDVPADFSNYVTSPGVDYSLGTSVTDYMPRIISRTITTAGVNLLTDGPDGTGHYVVWDPAKYGTNGTDGTDLAYGTLINGSGVDVTKLVEGAKIVAPVNTEVAVLDANGLPLIYAAALYTQSVVYTTTLAVFAATAVGGLKDSAGGTLTEGEAIWYRPSPGVPLVNTGLTYQPDALVYKQLIDANVDFSVAAPADGTAIVTTLTDSGYGLLEQLGHIDFQNPDSGEFFIGSENPGVAPVNSWFAIFGQFFDHGLDKINSGGQGTKITVALDPSDPLYGAEGPNGPVTSITISRATVAGTDANGDPNYVNHTSPFIDQSQTYGSHSQITDLLREWVSTDGGVTFSAGMGLFDGTTLADSWVRKIPVYNTATGLTEMTPTAVHNTLPTLNELRDHVLDTGRDALTWDDVLNYRNRDDNGDVATGPGAGNSGQALLLDMNPRFNIGRLNPNDNDANGPTNWDDAVTTSVNDAIAVLNASGVRNAGAVDADVLAFNADGVLTLTLGTDLSTGPGPALSAGTALSGASSLALWVNFSNFNITAPAGPVNDAVGNILMASVGDHYVAGDGRVNENFGLTSIHHVFHEEHNFQVENLKSWIYQHNEANSPIENTGLHEWQNSVATQAGDSPAVGVLLVNDLVGTAQHYENANGDYVYANGLISWDADKMFNASKLIVEMEYQHAAVDQYARTVTPRIQEFVGYSSQVDSTVSLEFSQVAFRFGHSTIRETIDTIDPTGWFQGAVTKFALEKAFLAPETFAEQGVAAITLGLARQQMNEIDEFITPALNQGLLGMPLDLASINIARGRDLGIPTLNDFRAAIGLAEYANWSDFGANMIHPESLVNFIAAYSFDGDVGKAQEILDLADGVITSPGPNFTASEALAFMNAADTGNAALNAASMGYDKIDSWIGGLAEAHVPGSLLGETFDTVFVSTIQSLMDGDRFYYLYRLFGTQINEEVNNGQFKDIVERNTGLEHLNGSIFAYADKYYDFTRDADLNTAGIQDNFADHAYATLTGAGTGLGIFSDGVGSIANNGTVITIDGQDYIRDARPELDPTQVHTVEGTPTSGADSHEVIVATDNNDYIHARGGDDTIYGEGGDDIIYADGGVDRLYGGDGDDILDTGEGPDLADGGAGKDTIYGRGSGSEVGGFDQLVGGSGNDTIYGGEGIDKLSGGSGDDIIYGDSPFITAFGNTDPFTHGGDGNDFIDGGASGDNLYGDEGDDLILGGADQDLILGGTGDDIIRPGNPSQAIGGGPDEVVGDDGYVNSGFDLIDFSDYVLAADGVIADMAVQANPLIAIDGTTPFPAFFQMEGIIGSLNNDTLTGDNVVIGGDEGDTIGDNWLIGGSGNDTLRGNGGNDLIVGGSIRLDSLIGRYTGQAGYLDNTENAYTGASNRATGLLDGSGLIDAANATIAGTADDFVKHFTDMLRSQMFKDHVLGDNGADGTGDTAIFTGNREDYTVTRLVFVDGNNNSITAYKVADNGGLNGDGTARTALDGIDIVTGVENFQFADTTVSGVNVLDAPPAITTNGGADMTLAALNENTAANTSVLQLAVADVNATDPLDPLYQQTLQWTLAGGTAGLFQIDSTGNITLASSPNYEALAIAGQTPTSFDRDRQRRNLLRLNSGDAQYRQR